jgi:hypothetical protein
MIIAIPDVGTIKTNYHKNIRNYYHYDYNLEQLMKYALNMPENLYVIQCCIYYILNIYVVDAMYVSEILKHRNSYSKLEEQNYISNLGDCKASKVNKTISGVYSKINVISKFLHILNIQNDISDEILPYSNHDLRYLVKCYSDCLISLNPRLDIHSLMIPKGCKIIPDSRTAKLIACNKKYNDNYKYIIYDLYPELLNAIGKVPLLCNEIFTDDILSDTNILIMMAKYANSYCRKMMLIHTKPYMGAKYPPQAFLDWMAINDPDVLMAASNNQSNLKHLNYSFRILFTLIFHGECSIEVASETICGLMQKYTKKCDKKSDNELELIQLLERPEWNKKDLSFILNKTVAYHSAEIRILAFTNGHMQEDLLSLQDNMEMIKYVKQYFIKTQKTSQQIIKLIKVVEYLHPDNKIEQNNISEDILELADNLLFYKDQFKITFNVMKRIILLIEDDARRELIYAAYPENIWINSTLLEYGLVKIHNISNYNSKKNAPENNKYRSTIYNSILWLLSKPIINYKLKKTSLKYIFNILSGESKIIKISDDVIYKIISANEAKFKTLDDNNRKYITDNLKLKYPKSMTYLLSLNLLKFKSVESTETIKFKWTSNQLWIKFASKYLADNCIFNNLETVNGSGIDAKGLTRDLYDRLGKEVIEKYFVDRDGYKIISHDVSLIECKLIGKMMFKAVYIDKCNLSMDLHPAIYYALSLDLFKIAKWRDEEILHILNSSEHPDWYRICCGTNATTNEGAKPLTYFLNWFREQYSNIWPQLLSLADGFNQHCKNYMYNCPNIIHMQLCGKEMSPDYILKNITFDTIGSVNNKEIWEYSFSAALTLLEPKELESLCQFWTGTSRPTDTLNVRFINRNAILCRDAASGRRLAKHRMSPNLFEASSCSMELRVLVIKDLDNDACEKHILQAIRNTISQQQWNVENGIAFQDI